MNSLMSISARKLKWLLFCLSVAWIIELVIFFRLTDGRSVPTERWQIGIALLVPLAGTFCFSLWIHRGWRQGPRTFPMLIRYVVFWIAVSIAVGTFLVIYTRVVFRWW